MQENPEFVSFVKMLEIVPPTLEAEALMTELTISSQLTSYDLTQYDTLVIGYAHGLHDRSIIDHNHGCKQNHDSNSFIVDFNGYGFNAEIIEFNGLNVEHWRSLFQHLNGHRFNKILDHTRALFDSEIVYEEHAANHADKEVALKEVARFARENILAEGGTIDYLGQDSANHPISDCYSE